MDNFLNNLFQWAHRQGENFVTEAFVFLLNHLLDHDKTIGLDLINWLCWEDVAPTFVESNRPTIITQRRNEDGTPDIRITSDKSMALVEVKQWSPLHTNQLDRYWNTLNDSRAEFQSLVLLTVLPVAYDEGAKRPSKHVRWPDLAKWLRGKRCLLQEPVSVFLVDQFLDFLMQQGMTMERISWEYIDGTKSFSYLLRMLDKAREDANIPFYAKASEWGNWLGTYLDGKKFLVAVGYSRPQFVRFSFCQSTRYDSVVFERLNRGQIGDWGPYWEMNLETDECHFFSRTAEAQLESLTTFLKNAYADAKACLATQQPAAIQQPPRAIPTDAVGGIEET